MPKDERERETDDGRSLLMELFRMTFAEARVKLGPRWGDTLIKQREA